MRIVFLNVLLALSFSLVFSDLDRRKLNYSENPKAKSGYDVLQLGEIPIGLWLTPPGDYQTSDEYGRIKDCGINFVNGFSRNENSYNKLMNVLDYCEENGLKFFVNNSLVHKDIVQYSSDYDVTLLKEFTDRSKPFANHPAFVGELLMDEPGKPLFEAVNAFSNAFENAYPEKLSHVNLLPSYATGAIQAPSYEDYIDSWLETQNPRHISYDSYPLLTDGTIIDDYFYNLDLIRAKSRNKKIPFWSFIQTLSISGTPGVPDKRAPSEADIRWQVWSNLAFGAKGIQYFCYWTPSGGKEQFGEALIGLNGETTVRYDYVKKLNADINAIGKMLLECDAEGVIQNGDYKMYSSLYKFGDVDSVSGDGSLVGCFTSNKGQKKMLITGLNPDKEANVILNVNANVRSVNVWVNGKVEVKSSINNKLIFYINAGEAALVEF